jgi:Outer membrane efflux protein
MTARRLTALAAVLVAAGLVLAQPAPKKDGAPKEPPKPAPGSLEDTLDKALRNSADIKAAEAKVRESEAQLHQVRQQVLTRATALHADLNLAKRMLAVAERGLANCERLEAATVPVGSILAAQAAVEKHRGEVEKLETELKSLRGEFAIQNIRSVAFDPFGQALAVEGADGAVRVWDVKDGSRLSLDVVKHFLAASKAGPPKAPAVSGSMFDRVKKLLDQEVAFESPGLPLEKALRTLVAEAKSDIPIRVLLMKERAEVPVELPAGKLPVGAWIQALEDTDPEVAVVVRDYGLLLTWNERIPAGAVAVSELWKMKKAEEKGKN